MFLKKVFFLFILCVRREMGFNKKKKYNKKLKKAPTTITMLLLVCITTTISDSIKKG
jgi:hypothetical protein